MNVDQSTAAPSPNQQVGGILLFFIIMLVAVHPLLNLYSIVSGYSNIAVVEANKSIVPEVIASIQNLHFVEAVLTSIGGAFSIVSGIMLWRIHPRAIPTTRALLWYLPIAQGLILVAIYYVGLPEPLRDSIAEESARSLTTIAFASALWYHYLKTSNRVRLTYSTMGAG